MYEDIINSISYSVAFDTGYLTKLIFSFAQAHGLSFFACLGIMLGVKFLKDSFN